MASENWDEIALQMGCPEGPLGIRVAHTMNKTNKLMTQNAINNLKIKEGDVILELGHGNCGHLEYLLSKAPNLTFYGLEISEQMRNEAIRLNEELLCNKVSFTEYDGNHIPFADAIFDKILTVNTIYFWQNPVAMLQEIHRVLKKTGLFALTFAEKDFMETMPFTKSHFTLYNLSDVEAFIDKTEFSISERDHQHELYKDKSGKEISRNFITLLLKRE